MEKINVIHITQKFWPTVGGGQVHIMNLVKELVKEGISSEVICLGVGTKEKINNKFGFPIVYSKYCNNKRFPLIINRFIEAFWIFVMFFKALKFRKNNYLNIIHTHDEFAFLLAMLFKPFFKYKLVDTEHRSLFSKGEKITKMLNKINYKLAKKRCDYIIAVDDGIKKRFKEYNLKNIDLIENGVNVEKFKPEKKRKEYITFVGRFDELKGADLFLKLAIELNKKLKSRKVPAFLVQKNQKIFLRNLKFLMIGEGPLEEFIKNTVKKENIDLTIKIAEHEQLKDYFNKSILVISPLRINSLSLVSLESMACGAINLKSDISSRPITNEKNGFIFKINDFEDLVSKTEYIIKNQSKIDKIGLEARKTIIKDFDIQKSIMKTINIYKLILG
ncbi:hypothetical protein CO154_01310 [Candidatus Pacearchaeota archaeon CG_4_9_14_3_um_filter_31_7]|nr:MAG: hypothetical protein AUJ10_02310 [Candidatus Pacearchaeota archaeon CG1_02_31_27]PIN92516.1 MAG: hypothetical protein COU55_01795 [Candidatus Pacearchaeota archaeon CG10_big_fil_rev_8_21_14_0_10_31_59]PIZ80831.1 MAG: hypothetical protein COX99_01615 [Candidatus Pacearchaeota archaeon CG_4_10_14_0_2_um_filter_31_10]PJA70742.1 MAG: hypothetical protein CO154_01310 [Candidatus Pacearchaeota archaeon CG_4_9_14_3_um_filter_31_7]